MVRARVGLSSGGATVGFRHGAGAGVGMCVRAAVGFGLDEVAGQHAGEHLGLSRQQGSTLQGGGAGEAAGRVSRPPGCLCPRCSPRHLRCQCVHCRKALMRQSI